MPKKRSRLGAGCAPNIVTAALVAAGPVPYLFIALTANDTDAPLGRLGTLALLVLPVTEIAASDAPPSRGVTVYEVMGPPRGGGAVQETMALLVPGNTDTPVGAAGIPAPAVVQRLLISVAVKVWPYTASSSKLPLNVPVVNTDPKSVLKPA